MAREPFRYHRSTVVLWVFLGAVIVVTSVAAVSTIGLGGLWLVIMGWIVGPFVLYWMYKKMKGWLKKA